MGTDGLELVDDAQQAGGAHSATERAAAAVNFDLDSIERDDPSKDLPPYTVTVGGQEITMRDPVDCDWQELANLANSPGEFATVAMNEEDREHFLSQKIPAWKLQRLIADYERYYDIEEPGKAG